MVWVKIEDVVFAVINVVNSLYLNYALYLTSLCLEHFLQIHHNFLSLSRPSSSQNHLEWNIRFPCGYSLPILNLLLACSVIQVGHRVSYENTVGSLWIEHLGNLECKFQKQSGETTREFRIASWRMNLTAIQIQPAWFPWKIWTSFRMNNI